MLRSLEDLYDARLIAADGEIGRIRNFLFDDESWIIRYVVADVGSWLNRHGVVIAVSAIHLPDWEHKTFRTALTRDQVRRSPDVDSQKPVSRQQEIALQQFYGWSSYWQGDQIFPLSSVPAGREFPAPANADPHLRSVEDITGYTVWAADGEIGRLDTFVVDEASWHIGYLDVKAGGWLHGRSVLVPTPWVKNISWGKHRVELNQALTEV